MLSGKSPDFSTTLCPRSPAIKEAKPVPKPVPPSQFITYNDLVKGYIPNAMSFWVGL